MGDWLLRAVDDLLGQLETVTRAGQQHLMNKVVALLTSHSRSIGPGPFIAAHVDELREDAKKAAPDGAAFSRKVRRLLAALSAR